MYVHVCMWDLPLTDLHAVLQSQDFLLLLLQEGGEGFHVLQRQLQDHGLLQMSQSLQERRAHSAHLI